MRNPIGSRIRDRIRGISWDRFGKPISPRIRTVRHGNRIEKANPLSIGLEIGLEIGLAIGYLNRISNRIPKSD